MKNHKDNIIFICIIVVFVLLFIIMSRPEKEDVLSNNYLYSYTGNNDMSIDEIFSNARMECKWFKDCPVVEDVVIELGDYSSVQIIHPEIHIDRTQANMYNVVTSMLTEHIYLSKYIAENYDACKEKPVKIVFNYTVNGLEVKYVNSTSDFDDYYSTETNEEVFDRFIEKSIITRWGAEAECNSFDRAMAGEK